MHTTKDAPMMKNTYRKSCDLFKRTAGSWENILTRSSQTRTRYQEPSRKEILEAKKEKCFRILIAELHSMEETLQRPFLVGDPGLAKSHVEQAAYDLGEVMFELAQLEKEENQ